MSRDDILFPCAAESIFTDVFTIDESVMKNLSKRSSAVTCVAVLLSASFSARAQTGPVSKANPDIRATPTARASASDNYWTPERFKSAKPLSLPQAQPGTAVMDSPATSAQARGSAAATSGQPPSLGPINGGQQLFAPDTASTIPPSAVSSAVSSSVPNAALNPASSAASGETPTVVPQAVGTFGAHYTSSRVFPIYTGANAPLSADRNYPYSTVGKLFFSINGVPYLCSASVIQQRVVATAGHCVHSGTASGFYSNFVFVPAFRDGVAPFKSWIWRFVTVTGTWAGGGGGVPNSADYAMLEFADQPLVAGGAAVKLGYLTGWLVWQTLSLSANHTSKLGYPCNLDNCQKMQNVTSSSFRTVSPNNVEYGSDAEGGSSGGPWVQNFQQVPVGGGSGANTSVNRLVGVTSYGYAPSSPKVQGASILDARWQQLWTTICARAGNCS